MGSPFASVGGNILTIGGAIALLYASASSPIDPPVGGGPMPTAGQVGWWDASSLAWGSAASTLTDKSTAGKNASTSANAIPRLAGALGGLYSEQQSASTYNVLHPIIKDYGVSASGIVVGANQALTVMLTWSRAQQRQPSQGALSSDPVQLLAIGGTPVLNMTAAGDGNDTIVLFPSSTAISGGKLELRHTHSVRVVFSGAAVDVWLDGAKVISAASQITLGSTAILSFVNAAQCIFHEAAAWDHALTTSEHADLTSYLMRWPLGPRRAVNGLIIGQSNADNLFGSFVTWNLLNRHVAYWTGCIASNILWRSGSIGNIAAGTTMFSGQGLYDGTANLLLNSSGGGDPSMWPLGANGNAYMAAVDALTADQRANLRYVAWYWSESDSQMLTAGNKATYTAAMKRAFALIRARAGLTAAQLPVLVISALPFPGDAGCQVHREVMQDLVNDSSQNASFMLAMSGDQIGQSDNWDASTGLESGGGNTAHRDPTGAQAFLRRWAKPIARAAVAANAAASTPDVVTAIDASVPVTGGPKIATAVRENATSVLVTVAHDGGNDLAVPLRAAQGVGWTLNTSIKATACVRVSATQLSLTFPSVPTGAVLHYGWGSNLDANGYAIIGRGNAVTDNFQAMPLAAGWRIGADLGMAEQPNNPLQATTYGITVS
jgi:hypothetical protein